MILVRVVRIFGVSVVGSIGSSSIVEIALHAYDKKNKVELKVKRII